MRLSWSWSLVPKFTALGWELIEKGEERGGRRKGRPDLGEPWQHQSVTKLLSPAEPQPVSRTPA